MTTPIPQPPGYPLLGNITDIDQNDFSGSMKRLNATYGEIVKLTAAGNTRYLVFSERLVRDLCDESRFVKGIAGGLREVRAGTGDGLFTAYNDNHDWGVAHRILTPAFGPLNIQGMFDEMVDIAAQLVGKWARTEDDAPINVPDDFTRLTLDSIALCAMDKRFNSFYHEELHPFVSAMTGFLIESGKRAQRTRIESLLARRSNQQFAADISTMHGVAQEVIDKRRRNPNDKKDLLNAMLNGKDPKTGERMSDESIMNNMLTFLIAGHETTSGLLSFSIYYLLKNPDALQRLVEEVDTVVGKGPVKAEHLSKLPYMEAVLRESLRLSPPAPAIGMTPKPGTTEPVLLGGEYLIPQGAICIAILERAQRDINVFGDDADEFKPERMLSEEFAKLPSGAWKPFGNGARGCIGRPFAWQEALLTLALVLQNFNLRLADPSYQLHLKRTLTVKPENFFIKASLRPGIDSVAIEKKLFAGAATSKSQNDDVASTSTGSAPTKSMTVLYGSNSGTCEGLAQKLASSATGHGYSATVKPLDAAIDHFPTDQPVILISASYEGQPPDNAALFTQWIKSAGDSKFKGAQCAVFGCGHKDWASTYQKIPTLLDDQLKSKGAETILPRGGTNVAAGTIFDDFDSWSDRLWASLGSKGSAEVEGIEMELSSSSRASHLRYSVQDALVLKNELLTQEGVKPEKRYMEFRLPTAASYEAGDYLALLPMNKLSVVSRVLRRFQLPWDATMKLKKDAHTTIPTEVEMSVSVVLASYVELNLAATKKNVQTLSTYAGKDIPGISADDTTTQSVLDILEANPDLTLPFAVYLSMLTPMRIRQYSISSSPLSDPNVASVTFALASDADADEEVHPGVATHYLKSLQPGSTVQVSTRKSPASFHPPSDPKVPMIMLCAGTGIAPFRGFIQDRAIKIAEAPNKTDFAPAVLFVGCRDPKLDKLHAAELEEWQAQGAVKVYYAYSRAPDQSEGCKYVQDRLWHEREECVDLFEQGAKVFICGSSKLSSGIGDVVKRMCVEFEKSRHGKDISEEEAEKWWSAKRGERFSVDVFD